jgi:hypothetical protein
VFALHHKYMVPPLVKKAHKIVMQLSPPQLSPKQPSVLTGRFEDKDGNPVRVKMGRYVLVSQQSGQQIPLRGGLIGPYAYEFSAVIDTRGLPPGPAYVRVDDSLNPEAESAEIGGGGGGGGAASHPGSAI